MKNTTTRTIAMLGLFVALAFASVSAHAQTGGKMTVNVPFDFTAGTAKLKAGKYTIQRSSGKVLTLRVVNEPKDIFVFVPFTVTRTERDLSAKLVFHRYGNEYFLIESWTTGEPVGNGLAESSAEHKAARELAKRKMLPQTVRISASVKER